MYVKVYTAFAFEKLSGAQFSAVCTIYIIMQDRHGRFLAGKEAIVVATSQAHAAIATATF